jgi:predicted SnoaL-like aldol condensation-catalyzing enzyme
MMEHRSNKTIIAGFYREIVRERKSELIANYVHEDYIQHSPLGKDGRQGLIDMVAFLKTLPSPAETDKSPIVHLIEEGDLVVAHLDLHFMGKNIRVIELFRILDGKAAEHWDVTEEVTDNTVQFIEVQKDVHVIDRNFYLIDLYAKLNITIHRVITDGDFTAVHAQANQYGKSIALFDIYHFNAHKLSDHWAAKQQVPDEMMHNNGMF